MRERMVPAMVMAAAGTMAMMAALVAAMTLGVSPAVAQAKKPLAAAEQQRVLAALRAANECAAFHYNRMERLAKAGSATAAAQAEELWLDWDDLVMDHEDTLDLPLHEKAALTTKVEKAHQAQLKRAGWAGYEKAWTGKCGKSPY